MNTTKELERDRTIAGILATIFAIALIAVAPFVSNRALAVETVIAWQLPATDCDGQAIPSGSITQIELYISAVPIPASGVDCATSPANTDEPPASFSSRVESTASNGQVTVDLIGGVTYYVRGRIRNADGWSNFSNQIERFIPRAPLRAPVIVWGTL